MIKPCTFGSVLLGLSAFVTQASDIFIADLHPSNHGLTASVAKNITQRKGYDNQPSFDITSTGLYYTAMFGEGDNAQTDSMYYSFTDNRTRNITNTAKSSEYSPTPIDNGRALSMIYVDESGSQKLWKTQVKTGKQTPINTSIEPVGYHAWGKEQDVLLFVLGDEMMLQYAQSAGQARGELITKNIGRSLRYNASKDLFSFSKGKKQQVLHTFDANTQKIQSLLPLPKGSEYYTWLNDDTVLSASGSKIYFWHYQTDHSASAGDWQLFADFSAQCSTKITRLAAAKDQSKLAFVCEDA